MKKLTDSKFFELLAKRAKKYGFRINKQGFVRECKTGNCPVVAVGNQVKGTDRAFERNCNNDAAFFLNMNPRLNTRVAYAADATYYRDKNGHGKKVRQKLFSVLKLKENS